MYMQGVVGHSCLSVHGGTLNNYFCSFSVGSNSAFIRAPSTDNRLCQLGSHPTDCICLLRRPYVPCPCAWPRRRQVGKFPPRFPPLSAAYSRPGDTLLGAPILSAAPKSIVLAPPLVPYSIAARPPAPGLCVSVFVWDPGQDRSTRTRGPIRAGTSSGRGTPPSWAADARPGILGGEGPERANLLRP